MHSSFVNLCWRQSIGLQKSDFDAHVESVLRFMSTLHILSALIGGSKMNPTKHPSVRE